MTLPGVEQPPMFVLRRRPHGQVADLLVAELPSGTEPVERVQQRTIGTPVDRERAPFRSTSCSKVGVDVATAERVDRLLWVPHQHQKRAGSVLVVGHPALRTAVAIALADGGFDLQDFAGPLPGGNFTPSFL